MFICPSEPRDLGRYKDNKMNYSYYCVNIFVMGVKGTSNSGYLRRDMIYKKNIFEKLFS